MNWPVYKIEDLVVFLNSRRKPVKASDRASRQGPFPYYGASGIVDWVDDYIFDGNFLLISEDGENLRSRNTPIAFMANGKYWVNNHAHILDEREPGVLRYLSWLLNITDLSPYITGAAQPKLNKRTLSQIEVAIPPLKERLAINAIIGSLDDKIELNRRMSATLEDMARSLYRSWFVDFDPVHAKKDGRQPAFMDEATAALFPDRFGQDGLPEGWEHQGLLHQSDWVNGAAYKNMHFSKDPDALPVIKIAELKAGVTNNTKFTSTDLGQKYRIFRGELLFSWSGNPDTSIDAFVWPMDEAWLNQHIFAVRPNGRMSKAMLFSCLRHFKPDMAEIARNKQTTGLGHITRKDLGAFPVAVASPDIMHAFEGALEPMFDRYCECLYENQTLAALRDSLLPKLMSGEIRVGEAREQVEEVA